MMVVIVMMIIIVMLVVVIMMVVMYFVARFHVTFRTDALAEQNINGQSTHGGFDDLHAIAALGFELLG